MVLPGGHFRGRYIVKFNELGPYLREDQCHGQRFFFDCLAVCTNIKPAPEKREFWGWWLVLDAQETHFDYRFDFGLYDKSGQWVPVEIKRDADRHEAEASLQKFFPRLEALMIELNAPLIPASDFEPSLTF
ncbi:sigma factor-binding protein Crl [Rosenbergiella australiborealis]|uniref:sigma factor-binding protein Crl n=1 Tax=Rosenbergiella australiborealis TaxID=1544696 RepID=UPI001F4D609F|nr:sigma factor-binding protein Crl [Rosenbergiella australiborealis]